MAEFCIEIAGQTAAVCSLFASTRDYCRAYLSTGTPEFTIVPTPEDLVAEQQLLREEALREGFRIRQFPDPFLERNYIQRTFAEHIFDRNILLFHGSAIAVDGQGYLFAAKSGTGKSTHTRHWQTLLGDRAVMINDDKPFLRFTSTQILVCGSPWSGKHGLDANLTVPLQGICILQRGSENRIRRLTPRQARPLLLPHGCPPQTSQAQPRYEAMLDTLVQAIPLWQMDCTKEPETAVCAWEAMTAI